MKYSDFLEEVDDLRTDLCKTTFDQNKDIIKVKKEKTVVKNLDKIFAATLKIGNSKGFQAMTMRDLSKEANLSMGALYSYFSNKEVLLEVFLRVGRTMIWEILEEYIEKENDSLSKLNMLLKIHLFLTEKMNKWFYFSYIEAKNLSPEEREKAINSEIYTEKMIEDILIQGEKEGIFKSGNHQLTASVIKAMLQDWYLKRWKYSKRGITVDQYSDFLAEFISSYYLI